jgi:hypothetical protein
MALTRTLGSLVAEARTILQDKTPIDGAVRYSDAELFECINGFFMEARTKRPDLYLSAGLRTPFPMYDSTVDTNVPFPLDPSVYPAALYYVVGRTELREDTFSQDSRAVAMMNKAISQLLGVSS